MTRRKRIEGRIARALAGLTGGARDRVWDIAFELLCRQRRRWAWVLFVLPVVVIGRMKAEG